jgi:hypothetical protein
MAGRYSCRGASVIGPVRTVVSQVGDRMEAVRGLMEKRRGSIVGRAGLAGSDTERIRSGYAPDTERT